MSRTMRDAPLSPETGSATTSSTADRLAAGTTATTPGTTSTGTLVLDERPDTATTVDQRHLAPSGPVGQRREPVPAPRPRADHVSVAARPEGGRAHSPVMVLLVLIATLGILLYAQFLLNPSNRGDILPYAMIIVAEAILVVQTLFAMWTILSGGQDPRDFDFHATQDTLYDEDEIDRLGLRGTPHLWPMRVAGEKIVADVFITVYGEELAKIATTVQAALALKGEHRTWVLDDGRSDEVRDLAAQLGARYIRRLSSNGAKAGNVNHALAIAKGDYFAIFDADFVPETDFLFETVPFFVDEKVAFVQTPQTYGNLTSLVSRGAGYMQTVFYRFIQPGRNRFNAAFCVGTNVIFRRSAIDEIGGIDTDSKSEDVWTSLHLHEAGWKSIYIPMTLAVGDAPETIEAYSKQQLRWATGGFEILFRHNPLSPRRTLTMDQRLQYFVTATNYLTGIAPLLLLMVPPMEIFFDLRPMNLHISVLQWFLFYAGFYLMQIVLAFYTLGSFRWEVLMLATVSFPIYVKALWNVISGKDEAWSVTGRKGKVSSPFNFIIPQVLFWLFLTLTSCVALVRDADNGVLTLATVWNLLNTFILSAFLVAAWREGRTLKRFAKAEQRGEVTDAPVVLTAPPGSAPVSRRTQVSRPAPRTGEEILALQQADEAEQAAATEADLATAHRLADRTPSDDPEQTARDQARQAELAASRAFAHAHERDALAHAAEHDPDSLVGAARRADRPSGRRASDAAPDHGDAPDHGARADDSGARADQQERVTS
ncbi:cellulose synthase catalytic subunit [Frigoribacterium sp. PhB116]|uniref:glycosyltransferase family 2 protein n=1 Tax=Frigoribacterium sp. PhB116 TaxID=2485174 RepID=UPI0010DE97C3|nr:cellulose synthase catalytic subunit [Frigoribacterium sp. PhB116]TDT63855.1 cellulose synthase (UDP-forming) [Frigoribacterium sp. PhB116]